MKDDEVRKIYLHASIAMIITLLLVVTSFVHDWHNIILAVFEGLIVFIFALIITSSIAGD